MNPFTDFPSAVAGGTCAVCGQRPGTIRVVASVGAERRAATVCEPCASQLMAAQGGVPAAGVHVTLYRLDVAAAPIRMTQALTDGDGRIADMLDRPLQTGDYRLEFDIAHEDGSFFTKLAVDLRVSDIERSYHVPLLLSPFSMTTYRGS